MLKNRMKQYTPVAILAAAILLIQLITLISGTGYLLTQLTMSAWYVLAAVGLCMVMGYAGQISMGQAGFFAIGGYTTAVLSTIDFTDRLSGGLPRLLDSMHMLITRETIYGDTMTYLTPWASLIAAILIAAAAALIVGIPVLKLKGHYLAMATMGFGIIINRVVLGTKAFGEADGITNVPPFKVLPFFEVSGDFNIRIGNYYFAWLIVIIAMVLLINLINSRSGRALKALHGSEEAADAMGVNTARTKVIIFMIGAVFAAAAGFFMTHYNGGIGPSESSVVKSVRYVSIVAVGGMANIWGTLMMGMVLNFLSLRGVFGHFDDAVFGIILVLIMMFMPDGFIRKAVFYDIRNFVNRKIIKRGDK
ncbi:MAG: branched-chain amino acid ABC transporter permease [Spirochaetales bacterium]|uniref:Branched-chain amino acid ABC transporter permease n=1 Tax=Candidatus Thalassospirochaeta sargassi TaxID=3119039 RepID=A0AAJ1IC33_9SPIO|nr:branched-chain amino acid ABC transporter permease [Spirochaetales bacterium]